MKNKIAEIRKTRNLTQRELANQLNIHYQVLQRYEKGIRFPTIDIVLRLAKALDCSVEDLFLLDD